MKMMVKKKEFQDPSVSSSVAQQKRFDGNSDDVSDPTLFATAFAKRSFYLFTHREPPTGEERDVLNEKSLEAEVARDDAGRPVAFLAQRAILRTSLGDIELELWPQVAPKA